MSAKNWKSYLKLIGCMALGACIGMGINLTTQYVGRENLAAFTDQAGNWLDQAYPAIGAAVLILTILAEAGGMLFLRGLIKKADQAAGDEEIEAMENRVEKWQEGLITFSALSVAVSVIMIGLYKEESLETLKGIAAYFLSFLVSVIFQTVIIHQMQKRDPRLKGDPNGFHFQKDFINSCDEAERMQLYRSGYKTYLFMAGAMPFFLTVALMIKLIWGTDSTAVLLLWILWLLQIIAARIYSRKEKKRNGKERERV